MAAAPTRGSIPTTTLELQEKFAAETRRLQGEFQSKLQQAQSRGDAVGIQKARQEFQATTVEMAEWLRAQTILAAKNPGTPNTHPDDGFNIYRRDLTSLDLNQIAYRGERNRLRGFLADAGFAAQLTSWARKSRPDFHHRGRLKNSFRLSPTLAPNLFAQWNRVESRLALELPVEIFATPDSGFQIWSHLVADNRLQIGVSASCLEQCSGDELTFLLGHEVGRALFGHFRIPFDALESQSLRFSPFSAAQLLRLRAWKNACEISAARIGLICSESLDSAAGALFKFSSGIATGPNVRWREYLAPYGELAQSLRESRGSQLETVFSALPFSPLRLKALELFSLSELYAKCQGRSEFTLTTPQLESAIADFVRWTEPTYLDEGTLEAQSTRTFLFHCAFWLNEKGEQSAPDPQRESREWADLIERQRLESEVSRLRAFDDEQFFQLIQAEAQKLCDSLPEITRFQIFLDLQALVSPDTMARLDILDEIGRQLKLSAFPSGEALSRSAA